MIHRLNPSNKNNNNTCNIKNKTQILNYYDDLINFILISSFENKAF